MPTSKVPDNALEKKVEKLESQLEIVSSLLIQSGKKDKSNDNDAPDVFENIEKVIKTITSISTSLVGLSFVFYAIGFVIVNLYLLSLGARKFDLLNPAYFSAGITFVGINGASIVFSAWFTFLLYLQLKKNRSGIDKFVTYSSKSTGINILVTVSGILSGFSFWFIWLSFSTSAESLNLDWRQKLSQVMYIILLSVFSASVSLMIQYIIETREIGVDRVLADSTLSKKFRTWTTTAILIMLYIPFNLVTIWGQLYYPQINPAFGGGKPVTIELVAKDDISQKSLETIGIKFTNGISESIKLVDDDEKAILIVLNNGNAVKISKDLLSNIIYLPSQTPTPTFTPTIAPSLTPTVLLATPTP